MPRKGCHSIQRDEVWRGATPAAPDECGYEAEAWPFRKPGSAFSAHASSSASCGLKLPWLTVEGAARGPSRNCLRSVTNSSNVATDVSTAYGQTSHASFSPGLGLLTRRRRERAGSSGEECDLTRRATLAAGSDSRGARGAPAARAQSQRGRWHASPCRGLGAVGLLAASAH